MTNTNEVNLRMNKAIATPARPCRWLAGLLLTAWIPAFAAELSGQASFDCLIEPSQLLEIRSPVTGLIDKVHAGRGDTVKRNAPLVSLESSVERAAAELAGVRAAMNGPLAVAESRLAHANQTLNRRNALAQKNYSSAQERDDAEAEKNIAQAELMSARESKQVAKLELAYANAQLGLRVIHSPIDGVVTEQLMYPGEVVEVGGTTTTILKLAQIDPLRVKMILPLAYYTRVKPGMRADIVPEAPLEGRYNVAINLVDQVIDAASGTFQVRADLSNPSGNLPGGVKCKATLAL